MPTDFDFQPAETAPDFDFQPEAPPVPRPAVNMQPVSLLSEPQAPDSSPAPPSTQPSLNTKRGGSSGILPPVTMGARRGGLQDTRKLPRFLGGTPPPEPTWKDIVGGAFGAVTNPEPGAETGLPDLGAQVASGLKNVTTPGQRTTGALQLAEAGTEAATPLMGPALLENPLSIARGVAEGEIASKATGYGAKKLGATPEQQQLAENLAFWAPGVARSVIDPKVTLASTEEGSAAGVSGFGGRVAAGGKVTPEEVSLGGKVGPFKGSVRIPRGPGAQPAIEPPTIEGHAITRAEVADYMDKANWDPDKARALAAQEHVAEPEAKPEPPAVKEPAPAPANFDFQPEVQSVNEQPATLPVPVAKVSGPSVAGGKEKEPVVPSAGAGETEQLSSGVSERPVPSSSKPERAEETPASKNDSVQTSAGVDTTPRDNTGASTPNVPAVDEPKYKHGSTQANIPDESEAAQALETARQRISPSDLAAKGIDVGGNHLTVRYGIKGDDTEGIRKYLSSLTPFEASLGKTDKFPPSEHSDGAAVIHAPVEAPELHQINKEIEKHGEFSEPSFGEYKPHATVAYVKPDKAARYVGMSATAGKKFTVNSIAITDRDGKQSEVKLEGKGAPVGELDYQPATKADNAPGAAISKEAEAQPTSTEAKPVSGLINAVYDKLKAGESLGNVNELNKLAEQHFGSARTSGQWTPKDAFDAMEAGVNKHLLDRGKDLMAMDAHKGLGELRELMGKLTSQGVRTEEQIKNQQFSTPPTESYVAAKVAGLKPSDVVLEPSAGNGGMAVWPKAIGAETHVNEIAPRRQEMLKTVGFDKPTAHDGEIINSLLDQKVKPTVILMNPPFSASAIKSHEAKNNNQFGFNHVDSALQRLEPGGRLVAILGGGLANDPNGGASLTSGAAGKWFNRVADKYNVRANVRIHGKEYQKYGTAFATRIIVIDKNGPTPSRSAGLKTWDSVVQGNANTLEEAYNALSGVADSRSETAIEPGRGSSARPEDKPATRVGASGSPSRTGDRSGLRGQSETSGAIQPASGPDRSIGSAGGNASEPGNNGTELRQPETKPEEHPATKAAGSPESRPKDDDGERSLSGTETSDAALSLSRDNPELAPKEEEDSAAYVSYRPTLKGPAHPANIVETRTMATVPLPEITYKPSLPSSVVSDGKLSAVQLEAISIAGQQNAIVLPSGERATALIGDGTGVGKGRIAAGIIWDNYRQGRKRLVWVSEKWDLMQDAIRDLKGIGAHDLASTIKPFGKITATTPIDHQGILFSTYALIRSEDKKGNSRLNQLQQWLRGQDEADGAYIVYDESHNLKNAVAAQGGQVSQIGSAIKKLMAENPKLRSASLSATAATDVINLGYLDRLGLWGAGTPFPNGFGEFGSQIASGGMSAMEMVARELKAQGKYVSRTLSYKGVTYREVEHVLTPEQKSLYRTATKAWASVVQQAEDTIKNTTNGGGLQKSRFMSLFYGAQLRFFNVLLTTLKIPTAVEQANKGLEDGKSVVITLVNTNEAAQNREKNRDRGAEDSDEVPDYDFGPGEMLKDLVREHYPTQQFIDDVDSEGRPIKVPAYVKDDQGRDIPLVNPQAVKERDKLISDLDRDLKMPANPLDILINSLGGPKKVAELTGRKERYDEASGKFVPRGDPNVKRDEINLSEMRAFQGGKKRVAILSSAAGTGISLHAGNDALNKQKRLHITLQPGWSADKAMQMMGRTHRSNEAHQPEYAMLTSDLGGEKRFTSTLAKRMGSLGALSKGQSNANTGTDLMEKVNFESDQGRQATTSFYNALLANRQIPGTDLTGMQILKDLRVLKTQAGGGETVPPADRTNVTRLLNRLLALDPDVQNSVYNYFYDIFQATVQQAVEDGTLDTGVKTLPGDEFSVNEERSISKDPKTGAETYYYPVEAKVRTNRISPKDLDKILKTNKGKNPTIVRDKNGRVSLAMDASPIVHASGHITDASYVLSPENGNAKKVPTRSVGGQPIDQWAAEQSKGVGRQLEYAKSSLERAKATAERYPDQSWAQSSLTDAEASLKEAQGAFDESESASKDISSWARGQWEKQYNEAPTHTTVEHHLIGGAVMRWWNPIHEASPALKIYTTVDSKSGKRVVGVDIPKDEIRGLLKRITGGGSTVNAGQLQTDVLKNGLNYTLEQNIQVRPGRVNRQPVVQFIPPNQDIANNLKRLGLIYEKGIQPVYYLPNADSREERDRVGDILEKILKEYPIKENKPESLISDESGSFQPSKLLPSAIKKSYATGVEKFISSRLKIGDKYYAVKQDDPAVAEVLHEVDNAPLYYRNKAKANLEKVTKGLTPDQIRLASLLVDSDSRDYLQQHKRDEYKDAINDPEVMAAVERFKPLQEELTKDRQALGWPVRKSLTLEKNETPGENPWIVKDRDGNPVADFKSENQATDYIEENATVEPHLKRTYPEHMRSPLPADTGGGPFTGTFYADKGLRPPRMDKKARIASAEYHYQHGAKDFSGYPESFAKTKEAVLKQQLFDKFTDKATAWKAGTAQPPTIKYNGKTYTRPDIVLKAKQGGTTLEPYGIYDPSRGERFLIKTPAFSTLSTGKPGIGPNDRFLAPKRVVDALERYDATRGGEGAGKLRKFFQEQIVGLFGPVVHVNNILRHAAQATGALGTFDPRSWPTLQKIIFSGDVRKQVLKGLDDSTIDMLSRGGSYTDWSDIGNLNAYIGGNLNPANWIRSFGKGVLFNPKFAGGWGGLDPKARTVVADFLKDHVPGITDPEIRSAVEDGFGNYNRKNWTERQRMIAKFTLFPGWDTASFKWFLRHPILAALVPAAVMLAANLAMNSLGKNKDQDKYDFSYLHYGDRKFRSGLITDSMASHVAEPVLAGIQAAIKDEEIGAAVGEGFIRGAGSLAGTLVPEIQLIAEQLFNRKFAGSASEIVSREDRNIPGKVLPNRDLEKRAIFAALKIFPAVGRFLAPDQTIDLQTGIGSALGVTNYKYGAEERLKANTAKAMGYSQTLSTLGEREPEAAEKFVADPNKAVYLMFNGDLTQMEKDLKEIGTEKEKILLASGVSAEDKREALKDLDDARQQLLKSADALNDQLTDAKLQLKKAQ